MPRNRDRFRDGLDSWAILFYATVSSETVVWWFIGRFQGVVALAVGVAGVLAYFWGLVGLFKIVRAGLVAVIMNTKR
jgi:hypothetical protein